ncbi:MAG: HAMP domain-containing histidine kinase, partial [Chloroflexota bacterium]|nr:HAMP domain-containing histidine kinase [Chloroflexota bacterium]
YADPQFGPPDEVPVELLPIVGLTALSLTLGGIAWFLGRTMLRPLAATSQAARQVAEGDLDITLPKSRVREVAEVNSAFESMSAALLTSLQEQAELEQERRLFIGAVAHDLRTPLFALRGHLEGIESGVATTPEQQAHYIGVAREKADALERLISDLFDFTRLEYLDQAPNREPLDLAILLAKLVDDIQPRANTKGVTIAVEPDSDTCAISGDSHLLTRAVENLLDNALRFTLTGGSVVVTCWTTPNGICFSVSDSGPGISPDDLPNVFTPLYRGESSRNRRTGGAGLGLTIARRILLAHGGDLIAANRPEGGAVFTGTLPTTS